jgi:hypothetical protein
MTDTQLLIGSLSNDLFRVASLTQRGSTNAANRFLLEAKRWSNSIQDHKVPPYIKSIAENISVSKEENIDIETAEKYLMYAVLLQNYSLHQVAEST